MDPRNITTRDGSSIACNRFAPPDEKPIRASIVIAAAMAVTQRFYAPYAQSLAAQGFVVWTFDFRGTGETLRQTGRGMRNAKATLTDWFAQDYDAVICAAKAARPTLPLFAVGHSFGGQSAPLLPTRDKLAGLINIAVGSGAMRHNTPPVRRTAPFLWYLLAPVLCPLFGYFPGARVGVIGDIPTGALFQWRRWCLTPDYILSGEPGAREAYASARYPVLALTFADDELLLEAGSALLHKAYPAGSVDYRLLAPADVGLSRIGHFGFFKAQAETTLWPMVSAWIDTHLGNSRNA